MTRRLLSLRATAVVTTKMINTQQEGSPKTLPLPLVLAASPGEAAGGGCDTCLPLATGRPGNQSNRNRVDDHWRLPHPDGTRLMIIQRTAIN